MIVEYNGGGWNRIRLPERGSAVVYPDGLLNVLDINGRCVDSKHDARAIWMDEEALFAERPEYRDSEGIPQDEQGYRVSVYFADTNQRYGAVGDDAVDCLNRCFTLHDEDKKVRGPEPIDRSEAVRLSH